METNYCEIRQQLADLIETGNEAIRHVSYMADNSMKTSFVFAVDILAMLLEIQKALIYFTNESWFSEVDENIQSIVVFFDTLADAFEVQDRVKYDEAINDISQHYATLYSILAKELRSLDDDGFEQK